MKKLAGLLSGLLLAWLVCGCNAPEPQKFGVVDVPKVLSTAKASQKANAEIEAMVRGKQAELTKKGELLKNLEKSVKEPGSKVKPDEYNKAVADYQKLAAAAETEVKNKATELRKGVLDQIKKIIEDIGKEEKYVMIFVSDTVPYFQPAADITDKIVKKFDETAGGEAKAAPAPPAGQPAPPAAKPALPAGQSTPPATKPAPPATR